MGAIAYLTDTYSIECSCCHAGCGIPIVMSASTAKRLRESHEWFYCLNGHQQHFTGETEAERLKKLLEAQKRDADWQRSRREQTERQLSAARGQITKIKNRVGNGVCPCCNRTFQSLMQHMSTKHPEFRHE